jgi:Protein of unknown function (DUF726)
MGLPNHLSISSWQACRQVVAGRLVNCYSQNDLILSLMFQYKKFGLKPGTYVTKDRAFVPARDNSSVVLTRLHVSVCGTCAVNVPGVENVDVSDLVSGHQDYCLITGEILKRVRHGAPCWSSASNVAIQTK